MIKPPYRVTVKQYTISGTMRQHQAHLQELVLKRGAIRAAPLPLIRSHQVENHRQVAHTYLVVWRIVLNLSKCRMADTRSRRRLSLIAETPIGRVWVKLL